MRFVLVASLFLALAATAHAALFMFRMPSSNVGCVFSSEPGFGGPYLIGWMKEATGNTSTGLLVLSLLPLAAGLLVFLGGHGTKTEFAGAGQAK